LAGFSPQNPVLSHFWQVLSSFSAGLSPTNRVGAHFWQVFSQNPGFEFIFGGAFSHKPGWSSFLAGFSPKNPVLSLETICVKFWTSKARKIVAVHDVLSFSSHFSTFVCCDHRLISDTSH
jgi:hypothetical protein